MLIYDKAYMELRIKYLIPITKYSVPYSHLRNTNIKEIILNKAKAIEISRDNEYIFHFDESYILKALLGDIELFYIRQIIQRRDAKICGNMKVSSNWNIVTNYYNAFFAASLMLRLCYRGNIFLDISLKRNIEKFISIVTGNVVKLDSNQFYEVLLNENMEFVLKLTPMSDGTHELVWRKMDELVDEMLLLTRKKSDEFVVLTSIKEINNKLQSTYPSKLRNRVNYQPVYGLEYLDKQLYSINENISWVDTLINFTNTDDDNQIACYMYAYTKYIEYFCSNFIAEYYAIKGNQNGLVKRLSNLSEGENEEISMKFSF